MGLLSRLTKGKNQRKAEDDVLLFHAMFLMIAADGRLDPEEIVSLESFYVTVPDFRGKAFRQLLDEAVRLQRQSKTVGDSVKVLSDLSTDTLKKKAFLLATDIALSSGDVDEAEDELLDLMQRTLKISDEDASKIVEVLTLKYTIA